MDYKEYEFDNYTVHFIKTDKFKSTFVSMVLINDFKEESLIKNFVLRRLLTMSSKNLKDEVEVARKVYDLYNAGIVISNNICNNVITTNFDIEILQDKYTEKGLTKKALDNFFDCIFNPNIVDNEFEKTNYDLAIKQIKDHFEREKDNKRRYAVDNAYEIFSEGTLKYNPNGKKEDLKHVTRKNMVTHYNNLIKEANASIWAIGSFDDDEMLKIINDNVEGKLYKNPNNYVNGEFKEKTKLKTGEDIEKNNQSILVIICKLLNITDRERNVILPIFNRIFGEGNNCKLFKNVREKNSLCYDIHSIASREGSVLTITAGITGENKDKVVKLVKEELKSIQEGNIKEEFKEAIMFRNRALKQFEDTNGTILYIKQGSVFFDSDDLENRKKHLKTVKLSEIVELSKKVEISTIYMLKGEKNHEEN